MKWSYAVIQSIFGNLWVGKSKRKADNKQYFATIDEAIDLAKSKFNETHFYFDEDNEEENDLELNEEYNAMIETTIGDIEEIRKPMEKFVI